MDEGSKDEVLPLWKELLQLKDKCVTISARFMSLPKQWKYQKLATHDVILYDSNPRHIVVYFPDKKTLAITEIDTLTKFIPISSGPDTMQLACMYRTVDNLILHHVPVNVESVLQLMQFSDRFEEQCRRYRTDWKMFKEMKS